MLKFKPSDANKLYVVFAKKTICNFLFLIKNDEYVVDYFFDYLA